MERAMGDVRLKRLYPIALNVDAAAAALSCSASLLKEAADNGLLPCFANPKTGARRFLVEDLVLFVREHWHPTNFRSKKS
jgi:hypothetical protein